MHRMYKFYLQWPFVDYLRSSVLDSSQTFATPLSIDPSAALQVIHSVGMVNVVTSSYGHISDVIETVESPGDEDPEYQDFPDFEHDSRDLIKDYADERVQRAGEQMFNKFKGQIIELDRELRNFSNASRQLGSSVDIIASSFQLRKHLAQILYVFRENAADLFPRTVIRQDFETLVNLRKRRSKRQVQRSGSSHRPGAPIADQLRMFSGDVATFMKDLSEFPEFTDEAVNQSAASVACLEHDLRYWASCLKAYQGQMQDPPVKKYLHDLASEIGVQLESVTSSLLLFIATGVPTIRFTQQHASQNLMSISTVATIFTAVTATTMQFSYNLPQSRLSVSVNIFWFNSLVFSIGAAVNSLLGITWKQAIYRSPRNRIPWIVSLWIERSPVVFLVLSVASFSIGLVLFAFTLESIYTAISTAVFSAISSVGLGYVSVWIFWERWNYLTPRDQDHVPERQQSVEISMPTTVKAETIKWKPRKDIEKMRERIARQLHAIGETLSLYNRREGNPDAESIHDADTKYPASISETKQDTTSYTVQASSTHSKDQSQTAMTPNARFRRAARSVILLQSATRPMPREPLSRLRPDMIYQWRKASMLEPIREDSYIVPEQIQGLKLDNLLATQHLTKHAALVRHLHFSPDGNYLATSSWDRTAAIYRVGDSFSRHQTLAPQGFFGGEVFWSPSGAHLLTKLRSGMRVWTTDGVCTATINRGREVQSIAWYPGGESFLSVEGTEMVHLDLRGQVIAIHCISQPSVLLRDVCVMHNRSRLLCIGTLISTADGMRPKKSKKENQIIVYNTETKKVERRVPVLHELVRVTIVPADDIALVNYASEAPPQLWKLEIIRSDAVRLTLMHTYMPEILGEVVGPACLGGRNHDLVVSAGKGGVIYIWDRQSANLLHRLCPEGLRDEFTCIASNCAANSLMFATGSHDGFVRIWSTPADPPSTSGNSNAPQRRPSISLNVSRPDSRYGVDVVHESPTTDVDLRRLF